MIENIKIKIVTVIVLLLITYCNDTMCDKGKVKMIIEQKINAIRKTKEQVWIHVPPKEHMDIMEDIIKTIDKNNCDVDDETINRKLNSIAMKMEKIEENGNEWLMISEEENTLRGSGIYIKNCNRSNNIIIQIPHSFYDIITDKIGMSAYIESNAKWFMINTVHRYKGQQGEGIKDSFHFADLAHNENHLYQAVTKALAKNSIEYLFVQIHGFESNDLQTDIIISDGSRKKSVIAEELKRNWATRKKINIYKKDIEELGGTTNVQGKLINKMKGKFIHIEINLETRKELVEKIEQVKAFSEAIIKTSENRND